MLFFLFFFYFGILTFFLPGNVTSGDGAELVTVITVNGIAHPSGYPLYLIIAKIFTFFPIGSIPFRVSLFSAICSVGCLLLIYKLVVKITSSKLAGFFSSTALFLSYSFFYQSVFQKFYTFNLLLILILVFLGIKLIEKYDNRIAMLISFLLGLSFSNHHTGLFMVFPFLYLFWVYRKKAIKNIFYFFILFVSGALVNLYIWVKLYSKKFTFFPLEPTLENFVYKYIFRGIYPNSSLGVVTSISHKVSEYFFSAVNCLKILQANFPLFFTYVFFILGVVWLIRKHRILGIFLLITFFVYSVVLAKLTFAQSAPSVKDYYIIGNQYFLPMLAFFSLFNGFGFYFALEYIFKNFKLVKLCLAFLPFFYFIIFPQRLVDNLWSNNFAVYQSKVDKLFTKPLNSAFITTGDNNVFQIAYLKKVGNFRNDVCQILLVSNKIKGVPINCFINGKKVPEYQKVNVEKFLLKNFSSEVAPQVFSTKNLSSSLTKFYFVKFLSDFLLIEKSITYMDKEYDFSKKLIYVQKVNKKFVKKVFFYKKKFCCFFNYLPCLEHSTDDYFTMGACFNAYVNNDCLPNSIKLKLIKYNTAPFPYIYADPQLKKDFTIINDEE